MVKSRRCRSSSIEEAEVSGERVYRELERFVCGDYVHDALMACVDVLAFGSRSHGVGMAPVAVNAVGAVSGDLQRLAFAYHGPKDKLYDSRSPQPQHITASLSLLQRRTAAFRRDEA